MKTKTKLMLLTLCFAIANTASASFFQDFEVNNNGWNVFGGTFDAVRVPSGTNGITSHTGNFHAEAVGPVQLCDGTFSAATNWGGYSRSFPLAGFKTDVWVYLDTAAAPQVNDTRFDWIASSVNDPDCNFRRDFVFNAGFYNDSVPPGSENRFVISAGNNSGRCNSFPKNPGHDPIVITTSGWYKFEGEFTSDSGTLAVIMRVFNPNGTLLHEWAPLEDPTDIIGTTVGGNRYGWFPSQEFPFLAFDDSSLNGIQNYCNPGHGPAGSAGYWQNHPDSWCVPSITIGGVAYTMAEAIALMQHSTNKDMTYQMFAQLVAAELSVSCFHSDQTCVIDAMQAADAWMVDHPVGSNVAAKSSAWKAITSAYNTLVNYNTGTLCAPPLP